MADDRRVVVGGWAWTAVAAYIDPIGRDTAAQADQHDPLVCRRLFRQTLVGTDSGQ